MYRPPAKKGDVDQYKQSCRSFQLFHLIYDQVRSQGNWIKNGKLVLAEDRSAMPYVVSEEWQFATF